MSRRLRAALIAGAAAAMFCFDRRLCLPAVPTLSNLPNPLAFTIGNLTRRPAVQRWPIWRWPSPADGFAPARAVVVIAEYAWTLVPTGGITPLVLLAGPGAG